MSLARSNVDLLYTLQPVLGARQLFWHSASSASTKCKTYSNVLRLRQRWVGGAVTRARDCTTF